MDLPTKLPDENPRNMAPLATLVCASKRVITFSFIYEIGIELIDIFLTSHYISSGSWKCNRSLAGVKKGVWKYARRNEHLEMLPFQIARAVSLDGWRKGESGVIKSLCPVNLSVTILFLLRCSFFLSRSPETIISHSRNVPGNFHPLPTCQAKFVNNFF